ncbi:hypothetical protein I552_6643 [Mycobacterium xenopi 3993]|nr:hypothetical protein I552_6643 [Mycobacterium xenopi 3993]
MESGQNTLPVGGFHLVDDPVPRLLSWVRVPCGLTLFEGVLQFESGLCAGSGIRTCDGVGGKGPTNLDLL